MTKSIDESSNLVVKSDSTKGNGNLITIDEDDNCDKYNYGSIDSQTNNSSKWGNDRDCIVEIIKDSSKDDQIRHSSFGSSTSLIINNDDDEVCVFCLEPCELIRFCRCSVAAHKKCVLGYVTYPGNQDAKCCVCRRTLEYKVYDVDTTMKGKYSFFLCLIILSYVAIGALAMCATIRWILPPDMDMYLTVLCTVNCGALAALIFAGMVSIILFCCAPSYNINTSNSNNYNPPSASTAGRTSSSSTYSSYNSSYSSHNSFFYYPLCLDCSSGSSSSSSSSNGNGAHIALAILLVIALLIIIGTTVLVFTQIYKYHKSFNLKSKTDIRFKEERMVG